jgi:hypothetical protein
MVEVSWERKIVRTRKTERVCGRRREEAKKKRGWAEREVWSGMVRSTVISILG